MIGLVVMDVVPTWELKQSLPSVVVFWCVAHRLELALRMH